MTPANRKPSPTPAPVDETAAQDHRVRVASEKRARMRERLVAAAMEAFLHAEPGRMPVIDDVIRIAEVSRGTFYKYFDSLDELLADIGRQMAGEMLGAFDRMFGEVKDAAVCIAAGPLMAMGRAAMEPRHAAFISRVDFVDFVGGTDPRSLIVERSLIAGREQGTLKFESLDAAVDLVIGTSVEAARRILKTRRMDGAYIREVAVQVMRGLGLSHGDAQRATDAAWQHLQQHAGTLDWWQPVSVA